MKATTTAQAIKMLDKNKKKFDSLIKKGFSVEKLSPKGDEIMMTIWTDVNGVPNLTGLESVMIR